jgi:hypothetical protein
MWARQYFFLSNLKYICILVQKHVLEQFLNCATVKLRNWRPKLQDRTIQPHSPTLYQFRSGIINLHDIPPNRNDMYILISQHYQVLHKFHEGRSILY